MADEEPQQRSRSRSPQRDGGGASHNDNGAQADRGDANSRDARREDREYSPRGPEEAYSSRDYDGEGDNRRTSSDAGQESRDDNGGDGEGDGGGEGDAAEGGEGAGRGERRRRARGGRGRSRRPGGMPMMAGGGNPMAGSNRAALEAARRSRKECRVYVGNLAYDVAWNHLKDFMREAGDVVFSEVILLPNGMSKGCGVVEYSTPEEARRAIETLSERQLMGRQVFIREDREDEAPYGQAASFRGGGPPVGMMGRGGMRGGMPPAGGYGMRGGETSLFIHNLPYEVGWQDLKDLIRQVGANPLRADISKGPDGRSKGFGTVAVAEHDAQLCIQSLNGYNWHGRPLEVRLDRMAHGNMAPGMAGGGYGPPGGYGGYPAGGGGGYGGGAYRGAPRSDYGGSGRGYNNGPIPSGPAAMQAPQAGPSRQIYVGNLPWSTSNEDLVELFQTIAPVEEAEILYEGTRSKGAGVVQFSSVADADTAITKFNHYVYGGRALEIEFNRSYHTFGPMHG